MEVAKEDEVIFSMAQLAKLKAEKVALIIERDDVVKFKKEAERKVE